MTRLLLPLLLATSILAPSSLGAQTVAASDVVVMRRVIDRSNFADHEWRLGDWVVDAPSCSDAAPAHRTVSCVSATGAVVEDGRCRGTRPSTTGTVASRASCVAGWHAGAFGEYVENCSDATYRERTVSCVHFAPGADGAVVGDAPQGSCTQSARPDTRSTPLVANYSSCSFAWRARASQCDGAGYRDTVHDCRRSGGSSKDVVLTDAVSLQRCGTRPADLHVRDASCGPENIIPNGGFENGSVLPWQGEGGSKPQIIPEGHTGTQALYMTYATSYWLPQRLSPGAYEFSAWVKADGRGGYNPGSCYNGDRLVVTLGNASGHADGQYREYNCPVEWTRISISFRSSGYTSYVSISPASRGFAFDDIALIRTGN